MERAREEDLGILTRDICFGKRALRLVPLVDPIDHAEKSEGGSAWADAGFGSAGALYIGDQVFHKVNVVLLSSVDALAESRRQRMILVQHDSDFAIARAQDYFDMKTDECAEPFFGIRNATSAIDDAFLGNVHRMGHDVKEDFVLALKMVIQPAFRKFEGRSDVVHRGGVITLLLKKTSSGVQDFLAGINGGVAGHRRHGNGVRRGLPTLVGDGVPGWYLGYVVFNLCSSRRAFREHRRFGVRIVFISGWSFLNPGCGETGKDTHAFPMKIQGGTGGSEPVRVIANTFIFNCLHCFKAVLDSTVRVRNQVLSP